jgi:WD40 repeat protein
LERQTLGLPQEAKAVAFSPDGQWLAAGSSEGVMLWEMPGQTVMATLNHVAEAEKTDWVTDLAFSPDSTLLVLGRWIGILELWEISP